MKCPVCKDVTLLMSEKRGVEIDYCPECRGIWLDRGELEKIIEKEDNFVQSNNDSQNKTNENEKYNSMKKRKESFLGEIFDIFGD